MSAPRFKRIYLEITNVCNLQCTFCPVVERDKTQLSAAQMQHLLSHVAPYTDEVCFHLMGEPLNHPQVGEFVDLAQAAGVPVQLTTNGLVLDEGRQQVLLHPGVRQVNFSVHSYRANFPTGPLKPYLQKILQFSDRALAERPDLYINYRLWNQPPSVVPDDGILWNEADQESLEILQQLNEHFQTAVSLQVDVGHYKSERLRGRAYVHFDSRFVWPDPQGPWLGADGRCHGLQSHVGVHADGTVVPCCLDKEAVLRLGNLFEQSLPEILASERAVAMADGFRRGRLVEELCQRCDYIRRFA